MLRFLVLFLLVCASFEAHAAKPVGLDDVQAPPELYRQKNPISQIQQLLKDLNRYEGAVDGFMGSDLEQAIRLYQKEHGLPQNGKITRELIAHVENVARVQALLKRLENVREQRQQKARQALLSDPRTRELLEKKDQKTANPTRDLSECFANPNSACLLQGAVESSRAVFEDDMRDWALGEILAAQVSMGQDKSAMETAARIKDSRLIIAALTNIAKSYARDGRIDEALSSLNLIPFTERRLNVLLEVAKTHRAENQTKEMVRSVENILAGAATLEPLEESLTIQIEAAEILASVDSKRALNLLDAMTERARTTTKSGSQAALMRQAASAVARIGYPEWALKYVKAMPDDETRIPVLMAATRAFLDSGRFEAAQRTIARISAKRYRSVILSDTAKALWQAGRQDEALKTLDESLMIAKAVSLPFARNYALSNIAQTWIHIAGKSQNTAQADQAFSILQDISDDRLKARGLWNLAEAAQRHQFIVSQKDIESEAQDAVEGIKSKFSRAWVLGDLVAYYQLNGDLVRAKKAFALGLQAVEKLKNPWAKSRALAKFAELAHRFD